MVSATATDPLSAYLSEYHRQLLEEESEIAPAIILGRAYTTITDPAKLLDLGFKSYQAIKTRAGHRQVLNANLILGERLRLGECI
jgi:hypothetical protein